MVGYMIVRPYVLCALFIFAPLCSHVSVDGEALRVRSDRSASAIWRAVDYPGKEHLTLSWRWKIDRTIPDNTRTNAVSWFENVEFYVSGRSDDPL